MVRVLFGVVFVFNFLLADTVSANDKVKVLATTSMVSSIINQVAGGQLSAVTIVPPGMCPGHFDLKPSDIKRIENAELILMQGFEGEKIIDSVLESVKNNKLQIKVVDVKGSWMVPANYLKAVGRITEILSEFNPDKSGYFRNNARNYKVSIKKAESDIRQRLSKTDLNRMNIVCSDMQKEFCEWIGFTVICTYARPESFTLRELRKIVDKAKTNRVKLVVDSLQSGAEAGVPVAEELGAGRIVLTNFPKRTGGYIESLEDNVKKVIRAVTYINNHE